MEDTIPIGEMSIDACTTAFQIIEVLSIASTNRDLDDNFSLPDDIRPQVLSAHCDDLNSPDFEEVVGMFVVSYMFAIMEVLRLLNWGNY